MCFFSPRRWVYLPDRAGYVFDHRLMTQKAHADETENRRDHSCYADAL
jgi:hypothetical protein